MWCGRHCDALQSVSMHLQNIFSSASGEYNAACFHSVQAAAMNVFIQSMDQTMQNVTLTDPQRATLPFQAHCFGPFTVLVHSMIKL